MNGFYSNKIKIRYLFVKTNLDKVTDDFNFGRRSKLGFTQNNH